MKGNPVEGTAVVGMAGGESAADSLPGADSREVGPVVREGKPAAEEGGVGEPTTGTLLGRAEVLVCPRCGTGKPIGANFPWRYDTSVCQQCEAAMGTPAVDPPGTCHIVGCAGKGLHTAHSGIIGYLECGLRGCGGTWPGGQPFHIKGCPNDASRLPAELAEVRLGQADVAALLDLVPDRLHNPQLELVHRVSRALAVARNTTGAQR